MFWSRSIGEGQGQDYKRITYEIREDIIERIKAKHRYIEPLDPYNLKDRTEERMMN